MLDAVDLKDDLVEMPFVGGPGAITPDLCGDLHPELRYPDPDRLVGDDGPSRGEQVLGIAQAQSKAVVRPDGVSDDGAGEAMALEEGAIVEVQHPSGLPGLRETINLTIPSWLNLDPLLSP